MKVEKILSKEGMGNTLNVVFSEYFGSFLSRNKGGVVSQELTTGTLVALHEKTMIALDPWITKEEKKEEVK